MKFLKYIIGFAILGAAFVSSYAQGFGSDEYGGVRTIQLAVGKLAMNAASNASPVTVDITGLIGVAKIDITAAPDNTAGTMAFTVQSSADTTNWTTLSSVSIATNLAVSRTNFFYSSTGIAVTDTNLSATGPITTPTASSAGFATTYLPAIAFNSSASFTSTGPTISEIGFVPQDANRYLRLIVIPGGTGTNGGFSGVITGVFAR